MMEDGVEVYYNENITKYDIKIKTKYSAILQIKETTVNKVDISKYEEEK